MDDNHLIAQLDYTADVSGGIPPAHYLSNYKDFGGIKFATRRRAYPRNPGNTPDLDRLLVAINTATVQVS